MVSVFTDSFLINQSASAFFGNKYRKGRNSRGSDKEERTRIDVLVLACAVRAACIIGTVGNVAGIVAAAVVGCIVGVIDKVAVAYAAVVNRVAAVSATADIVSGGYVGFRIAGGGSGCFRRRCG